MLSSNIVQGAPPYCQLFKSNAKTLTLKQWAEESYPSGFSVWQPHGQLDRDTHVIPRKTDLETVSVDRWV